jgi:hypothetical protein
MSRLVVTDRRIIFQLQTFFAVLLRPHNAGQHPMPRGARALKKIALALAYVVLQGKPDDQAVSERVKTVQRSQNTVSVSKCLD